MSWKFSLDVVLSFRIVCSAVAHGMFSLFATHSYQSHNTIQSFTSALHVPYVTPSLPVKTSSKGDSFTLYMKPLYTRAIIYIIKQYGYNQIHYFYDNDEGSIRFT